MPKHIEARMGIGIAGASGMTLTPYASTCLMTPFVGLVADGSIAQGRGMTSVRKVAQCVAFVRPCLSTGIAFVISYLRISLDEYL